MTDFGKLLKYFDDIKSVRTTEQCYRCRGTGTETVEEVRDLHRSGGTYTRPCQICKGEGRIAEGGPEDRLFEKKRERQRPRTRRK
jgi:hypothetical protein